MKHINRNFRWNALSDPNEGGGVGLKFIFSEYGHVAYQIKGNDACSNMAVNILPVDTPTAPRAGSKIVSEYDQEIPQSHTADNPLAQRGRAAQLSRDTRKTN